ncbi:hypothetical protein BIV60_12150 [Bacillus sp. MUM 116]|uniref:hypothetical protein n=1 Tax=Bacillus sp. MUM 116 TaxID=1678002 RepID=UPI0008F55B5D|nr:hypothetical protein [Bacillus sp. MUM 116]OIK14252.1 hypothetical protein BIV60_12150 [Bacillus sp. MUM 116]
MNFRIKLINGLSHPNIYSYQIRETEVIRGLWKRVIFFILFSGLVFGISAYFGIGSEYLSKKLISVPQDEFEMHKALFVIGQILFGIFYAAIILFIPAFFFWMLIDVEFNKLIVAQLLVLVILLIEKIVLMPFILIFGLATNSSPFSFGVIIQYFTGNEFIMNFLATITLFKIWALFIEFKYLKVLTKKSSMNVLAMVIGINVIMWLCSTFLHLLSI